MKSVGIYEAAKKLRHEQSFERTALTCPVLAWSLVTPDAGYVRGTRGAAKIKPAWSRGLAHCAHGP